MKFPQLGVVFLEQGKASQALAYLDKALEFDPEHEQALLNSAILLQELGRAELRKVARERLLKLLRKVIASFFQMSLKLYLSTLYRHRHMCERLSDNRILITSEYISTWECWLWTIMTVVARSVGSAMPSR